MKIIYYLICLSIACSCNIHNNQSQRAEKLRQDSLKIVKQSIINDSIADAVKQAKAKRIELSKIAYGDATFGMSLKKALNTDAFKGGKVVNGSILAPDKSELIGEFRYIIWARFFEDQLYHIEIISSIIKGSKINSEFYKDADNLKDVIEIKYGEPDKINYPPNYWEFEDGTIYWMYSWNLEDKSINIGMTKSFDPYFEAKAYIYNIPLDQRQRDMEKTKNEMEKAALEQKKTNDASKF